MQENIDGAKEMGVQFYTIDKTAFKMCIRDRRWTARCKMGSSMLSSAARISSTVQMVRSCVDFLGLSTGTGLLTRMPYSTAYWKAVPSSRCISWMVVPERNRCFCFSET